MPTTPDAIDFQNRPFSLISDLRDLDLDLGSGYTAYRRVSLSA